MATHVVQLARQGRRLFGVDGRLGTLAYMYTEEPPVGLEMHPNVAVWLCHMFPSCDSHPIALLRDFLKGYYGAAWEPIWDYIQLLHDKVADDGIHMHLYTNPAQGNLPDEIMARAETLFNRAEGAVAGDAELLERVRVARMPLTYAKFFPRNGYEIRNGQLRWQGEMVSFDELDEFLVRMEAHGFEMVREASGEADTLSTLYMIIGSTLTVETLRNDFLTVEVVPMLAGRALRITELATGEVVTAYNVRQGLFFPFSGGLEDRSGGIFSFFGWVEPGIVDAQTERSITTSADLFDGLQLTRTLTLDPDAPIIRVESRLTNPSSDVVEARLRSHLELALGDVSDTRVQFTSLSGERVDRDLAGIVAGLREGEHYYDQDAPEATWTLSGTKGLQVTQRFDNAQVDFTWLTAYPASLNTLEVELWAPRATLGPGESVVLTRELEIQPSP